MTTFEIWIIIILIVGVIASNLAVLKYSAKFKMPQFGQESLKKHNGDKAKETDDSSDSKEPPKPD